MTVSVVCGQNVVRLQPFYQHLQLAPNNQLPYQTQYYTVSGQQQRNEKAPSNRVSSQLPLAQDDSLTGLDLTQVQSKINRNDQDDEALLYDVNDNATRATLLWRDMATQHPRTASKAAMYWRIRAAQDPKTAASEAMQARKMIATNPEVRQ